MEIIYLSLSSSACAAAISFELLGVGAVVGVGTVVGVGIVLFFYKL